MFLNSLSQFAVSCGGAAHSSFFGFPTWYEYLGQVPNASGICSPQLTSLSDVWLIVAAIVEILLRIAALAAVGFIIYAGFQYLTSQGEPDKTAKAQNALTNALVGLAIAVLASVLVAFIARSIN